ERGGTPWLRLSFRASGRGGVATAVRSERVNRCAFAAPCVGGSGAAWTAAPLCYSADGVERRDRLGVALRDVLLIAVGLGDLGGGGVEVDRDPAGDELGAADDDVLATGLAGLLGVGVVGKLPDHDDRHPSTEGVVGVLGAGTEDHDVLPDRRALDPLALAAVELAVVHGDREAQHRGRVVPAMREANVAADVPDERDVVHGVLPVVGGGVLVTRLVLSAAGGGRRGFRFVHPGRDRFRDRRLRSWLEGGLTGMDGRGFIAVGLGGCADL